MTPSSFVHLACNNVHNILIDIEHMFEYNLIIKYATSFAINIPLLVANSQHEI